MAESEILVKWDAAPTDVTPITNLNSLANGNIWQSGEINNPTPSNSIVRISYELDTAATPTAGYYLAFWIVRGDEAAANEIWPGGIGTTESEISTAASVAAALAAFGNPARVHGWQTSHGVEFKGVFDFFNFGPSWQVCVQTNGEALAAATNRVRYRYGRMASQ